MFILFILGVGLSVIVFYYAFTQSEEAIGGGAWGDFIGGTLNPILTFLTFTGVLLSIFLQRLELGLSRSELERSANALEKQITSIEKQNFEAAFFQMLNTFNTIVESIDLYNKDNGMETSGRDCFRVFYTRLNKIYRDNKEKGSKKHAAEAILRLSYFNFWKQHQLELGHYYRFLFNVFRFLDESPASEEYHAKLLRAQLSDQELLLLFYNCLSQHGQKFSDYAIKYKLFDNLPTIRLLEDGHTHLIDQEAFGDNPMYNSKNIGSSF
ncbi:putative phage abortive infection protein [Mameliella sp. CS4]|uniref:putative phage abortive infection protein n=1 Tax=Mameliella sp. CS4 TaxID=2862329 RepID=UPI001C5D040A|nr:putative phage abortive infection protein [Mameliella sp. CS4]